MLKSLIYRSPMGKKDHSAICLHAAFCGSMQTMKAIAGTIYTDFVKGLEDICVFDMESEYQKKVQVGRLMTLFEHELSQYGRGGFFGDGFLKTNDEKYEQELERMEQKLFWEQDRLLEERLEHAKKKASRYSSEERKKRIVEELLRCKTRPVGAQPLAAIRCFYGCSAATYEPDLYFAELDLKIGEYYLTENLEEAALYLSTWLEKLGGMYEDVTGYVCEGDFFGQFCSPKVVLFSQYPDGEVRSKDGRRFSCKEWRSMHFTESIEWANLLSETVAGKIAGREILESSDEIEYRLLSTGNVVVNMKKAFAEFRQVNWKPYRLCLEPCLSPGYLQTEIDSLLYLNQFDLDVDPDDYMAIGENVAFRRGNFEFLIETCSNKKWQSEERPTLDWWELEEKLEERLKCQCTYLAPHNGEGEIKKMAKSIIKRNHYPIILCMETPMLWLLSDLFSEDCAKIEKGETEMDYLSKENFFAEDSSDFGKRLVGYLENGELMPVVMIDMQDEPWRIFEELEADRWLNCGSEIISTAKHWFEAYGAVPATIKRDAIEFLVPSPAPLEKSMDLAIEQCAFCPAYLETLGSRDEAVANLASALTKTTVWRFGFYTRGKNSFKKDRGARSK